MAPTGQVEFGSVLRVHPGERARGRSSGGHPGRPARRPGGAGLLQGGGRQVHLRHGLLHHDEHGFQTDGVPARPPDDGGLPVQGPAAGLRLGGGRDGVRQLDPMAPRPAADFAQRGGVGEARRGVRQPRLGGPRHGPRLRGLVCAPLAGGRPGHHLRPDGLPHEGSPGQGRTRLRRFSGLRRARGDGEGQLKAAREHQGGRRHVGEFAAFAVPGRRGRRGGLQTCHP
mmetsp:Transcript_39174/g.87595  ORF Transcript_39174/g.87595 Transcript_39174/m.87595 type:complete len:227 (+) Transcript_39174:440-1120(+)